MRSTAEISGEKRHATSAASSADAPLAETAALADLDFAVTEIAGARCFSLARKASKLPITVPQTTTSPPHATARFEAMGRRYSVTHRHVHHDARPSPSEHHVATRDQGVNQ
ncbi:Hypothetical protein A7982_11042 [Minicystis rosea]|nr:Hypothetical protein A7982_11042 [Minicystis rosea]